MDVVLLLTSFAVILCGALLFTNAVEWLGHRLGLGEGAPADPGRDRDAARLPALHPPHPARRRRRAGRGDAAAAALRAPPGAPPRPGPGPLRGPAPRWPRGDGRRCAPLRRTPAGHR